MANEITIIVDKDHPLQPLMADSAALERINNSGRSLRAKRIKQQAAFRPDVQWQTNGQLVVEKILGNTRYRCIIHLASGEYRVSSTTVRQSATPLTGGSGLSNLIAEADTYLVTMRKIVQ